MRLAVFALCSIACVALLRGEAGPSNREGRDDIELEIVRDVIQSRFARSARPGKDRWHPEKDPARLYFLTTTPVRDWGGNGSWKSLPDSFHKSIENLAVEFLPASEAQLVDRAVYRMADGKRGWMLTVYVSSWISDTEAEVIQEMHRSPRLGSGTTESWIKSDGLWVRKPGAPIRVRRY